MALIGRLEEFEIADILQLIQFSQKDGCLTIKGKGKGKIFFEGGLVTHAICGDRKGERAIEEILRWKEGEFNFEIGQLADEHTIDLPIQHIILESARKIDEWHKISRLIPSVDVVVKIVEVPDSTVENIRLTPNEWRVLSFVDGKSTIKEIAKKANLEEFETAKIFFGLASSGLVMIIK
ncbi:hypothetical protein DRP53_07435 [candidate division WOR-3 bacterium]|uniref:PatA-like N-terminal domain-containing protein n=1 Tax=candidate division WOR-3 bacterium TaxID=2052148 RepID=A0A660SI20_UNCW3|nr:MAG: hypothetical protein DRP53_07435 [candidate division WOR-3 bacterium]